LLSIILICFASSCRRCQVCKKHGLPIEKICRDGYESEDGYQQALSERANAGYTCF
jgi:hypothetical protein